MEQLLTQLHVAQTLPNQTAPVLLAEFRSAPLDSALPLPGARDATSTFENTETALVAYGQQTRQHRLTIGGRSILSERNYTDR